jgi:nucleoside-triphosphatase THEP1
LDLDVTDLKEGLTILTGGRGTGKTRTCQRWADQAMHMGWEIAGLICPAMFEGEVKTAIDVVNLASGERCRLASHANRQTGFEVTNHWEFSQETMTWCNDVLGENKPCDLLIVDELGPLEFHRREGWVKAFDALQGDFFRRAVVVIRPELLGEARSLWPEADVLDLDA